MSVKKLMHVVLASLLFSTNLFCFKHKSLEQHLAILRMKNESLHVVVFSPHPDDDILGCGGSIAHHVEQGDEVSVVYMTSGEKGSGKELCKNITLAMTREHEANQALNFLGVNDRYFLRLPDGGLQSAAGSLQRVSNILDKHQPDVIYIPHEYDNHTDHIATNKIVLKSISRNLTIKPLILQYEVHTPLQAYDFILDIEQYIEMKKTAIQFHKTQIECGKLYDKAILGLNTYRGCMTKSGKSAECFKVADIQKQFSLIDSIQVSKTKIIIKPAAHFRDKFLIVDTFFIEYEDDVNIENLDESILILPFLLNVMTIIWISGEKYTINRMDRQLYQSLKKVKKAVGLLYPNTQWDGELVPQVLVDNHVQLNDDNYVAMLFSHGLDSICASFRNFEKKQHFITAWGHYDTPLHNQDRWQQRRQAVQDFAERYNRRTSFLQSNYHNIFNREFLDHISPEITNWRLMCVEGLGWIGLSIPIMMSKGLKTLYIGSSLTWESPYPHFANAVVDEAVRCAGVNVVHDSFDLSRGHKCDFISNFIKQRDFAPPQVFVCARKQDGSNCSRCIKCLQTMLGFYIAGVDYTSYGFDLSTEDMKKLIKEQFLAKSLSRFKIYHFMGMQKLIREKLARGEKIDVFACWFYRLDLEDYLDPSFKIVHKIDYRELRSVVERDTRLL